MKHATFEFKLLFLFKQNSKLCCSRCSNQPSYLQLSFASYSNQNWSFLSYFVPLFLCSNQNWNFLCFWRHICSKTSPRCCCCFSGCDCSCQVATISLSSIHVEEKRCLLAKIFFSFILVGTFLNFHCIRNLFELSL